MKALYPASIALGVATILASAAALALDKSLPYRIGLIDYHSYMWVGRLAGVSVGLALLSFLSGTVARKGWVPLGLALLGLTPLLLIGGVHSGPNPEAWCFNNLRQIEGGKAWLADERGLTNGTPVTMADISRFLLAGQELRCAEGGTYIINSIGSDARCTFHGTIPEMEANWQKQMRAQRDSAANGSQPVRPETNQPPAAAGSRR
jgi:hypothetical protein